MGSSAKSIVIENIQLDNAVKLARSSPENGNRDAALLLTCFSTGLTVTEIARLMVSDYLTETGSVISESKIKEGVAYNGRRRPLFWVDEKTNAAIGLHLAERFLRGHGSTSNSNFRGLDPDSPLFVSGRTGDALKLSKQVKSGKEYYSSNQLSRLITRLFSLAGVEGANSQSGRRTLAFRMASAGIDYIFIGEVLGVESREAVKKLCFGAKPYHGDLLRSIFADTMLPV